MENTPYAFLAVSGSASILAFLVFLYGAKVLRRVRRVALHDRSSPSIRVVTMPTRVPTESRWGPTADPRTRSKIWQHLYARRFDSMSKASSTPWYKRVMKGSSAQFPAAPMYINEKADQARVRDAWLSRWQEQKKWNQEKMRMWQDDEGEECDWKWGKGKAKWARD